MHSGTLVGDTVGESVGNLVGVAVGVTGQPVRCLHATGQASCANTLAYSLDPEEIHLEVLKMLCEFSIHVQPKRFPIVEIKYHSGSS